MGVQYNLQVQYPIPSLPELTKHWHCHGCEQNPLAQPGYTVHTLHSSPCNKHLAHRCPLIREYTPVKRAQLTIKIPFLIKHT